MLGHHARLIEAPSATMLPNIYLDDITRSAQGWLAQLPPEDYRDWLISTELEACNGRN